MICSNFRTRIGFCRSKRPLALSSWFQMWYFDTNQWFIFLFTILQFELIKFAFQIRFQLVQNSCIQIRCLFFRLRFELYWKYSWIFCFIEKLKIERIKNLPNRLLLSLCASERSSSYYHLRMIRRALFQMIPCIE